MMNEFQLSVKQNILFEFVKLKHGSQLRKYTNEPYTNHVLSVAEIVSRYEDGCVEIALCHDLFEDTNCNFTELYKNMVGIGYEPRFAYEVCTHVTELTDVFTTNAYPYFNRDKRKKLEAERLSTISYKSQSVKYADLIDNTGSIVEHDPGFAVKYLKEKKDILNVMVGGNKELFDICVKQVADSYVPQEEKV